MLKSIFIYEDNDMLRESIAGIFRLDDRYELSGAFSMVMEAEEQIRKGKPDLVLMDIDMPGRTGIEAVKKIRAAGITVPVLMLTVFDDTEHVFDALRAGASGYLLKKHISGKLFEAIDEVLNGGAPMSPSIALMVLSSLQKPHNANPYQLTPRETEILTSLSRGNSYKMMAAEHKVSVDTIRAHIKNVYLKLSVHSQTEAVSKALREKLV